ncbi:MAG: CTP synthase [Firmicutes bacterium]|nr:CTP synthase [Bacillota bacterium]
MTRYVFVTGGVVSSLGKGIAAASLGCLLKHRGLKLTIQKFDPYINYDPGTMSPNQHGEIFVTEDGAETDLDLGHYERFIDQNLTRDNNVTTGKVYWSVIQAEREGAFGGKTVQVIPHITDEIKSRVQLIARETGDMDVVITEIGGTVGDIESLPFLEAIRQMRADMGRENVIYIHVTLVPYLPMSGELKTKPTQHSVKELRSIGIQPDIIVCRTEHPLPRELKDKIALFCDIKTEEVIESLSAESIYEVPLLMQRQGFDDLVIEKLGLDCPRGDMSAWKKAVSRGRSLPHRVDVALVGRYMALKDAYLSIFESLYHGGLHWDTEVRVKMIPAEDLTGNRAERLLQGVDAILIPGGFGEKDIEGKINAVRVARRQKIPFLGICLGMQCAVIEFARNVAGLTEAHSTEFNPDTPQPVIDLLASPGGKNNSADLRLGAKTCTLRENTLARRAYRAEKISERQRHRHKFNNSYRRQLEEKGMVVSGINEKDNLVEIVELTDHPWFLGVQFHPEFKSRLHRPHPLFKGFIAGALRYRRQRQGSSPGQSDLTR